MTQKSSVVIFILSLIFQNVLCHKGYCWRQFTGDIPEDAIIGGQDINHKSIYIGRAYQRDAGVIPIEIKAGETEFSIISYGLPKTTHFVEILCGSSNNLQWIPANTTHFEENILNYDLVIGGYRDKEGLTGGSLTNIGKINFNGETKIGKIDRLLYNRAIFFFIDKETIKTARSFEVMVYKAT